VEGKGEGIRLGVSNSLFAKIYKSVERQVTGKGRRMRGEALGNFFGGSRDRLQACPLGKGNAGGGGRHYKGSMASSVQNNFSQLRRAATGPRKKPESEGKDKEPTPGKKKKGNKKFPFRSNENHGPEGMAGGKVEGADQERTDLVLERPPKDRYLSYRFCRAPHCRYSSGRQGQGKSQGREECWGGGKKGGWGEPGGNPLSQDRSSDGQHPGLAMGDEGGNCTGG